MHDLVPHPLGESADVLVHSSTLHDTLPLEAFIDQYQGAPVIAVANASTQGLIDGPEEKERTV